MPSYNVLHEMKLTADIWIYKKKILPLLALQIIYKALCHSAPLFNHY